MLQQKVNQGFNIIVKAKDKGLGVQELIKHQIYRNILKCLFKIF